ncbi:ABC transporter ATP-binding protein/permease [Labrys sp. ZIDIC5]|uniref:ABC transporter ATP-binding protein/permease n=1 Tax=Labrys sedimenti TaxID=3106036 RepID=UPI002ACAD1E0|nr:ABC transporter ATP-binding protein/permease [Labrys sp. ZIDIC5]MDZ5448401.1 ABC transporter ATP-binding protein/permease [Labrys sp. ZIDIC5]
MVAQSGGKPAEAPSNEADKPGQSEQSMGGLLLQLNMMARAFVSSPHRNQLFMLGVGVFTVLITSAYFQRLLIAWNQPFYDALTRKDIAQFVQQILVFIAIAGGLLVLNVSQTWLGMMIKLKLRQGLVEDLIGQWMLPRRAFRLSNSSKIGVNPDQRLHEDARHLTELSTDLAIGLFSALIYLAIFIPALWIVSDGFNFQFQGYTFSIPGYLVWAAILFSATGSLMSWHVGASLVGLNADRYAREAEFRFSLVRVSEHVDAISLNNGEKDEERQLNLDLRAVLLAMRRLVTTTTRLTWVTAGYGWFTNLAPILVAAPIYLAGNLTFGGLMAAVAAFNLVQAQLRWPVDNFNNIADWRATLLRVANFRSAVTTIDAQQTEASHIKFTETENDGIRLDDLVIEASSGHSRLNEDHVQIQPGERVLIVSEAGANKTLLFRTLAGLWPFGSGQVSIPKGGQVTFMPRRPYLPQGTLRQILSYPQPVAKFERADFEHALSAVGLGHLADDLDRNVRWDKDLADEEQQTVAFARLALQKPTWIVIDEALEGLDEGTRGKVFGLFEKDLGKSTIVHIGRPGSKASFFPRTLRLLNDRTQADRAAEKSDRDDTDESKGGG